MSLEQMSSEIVGACRSCAVGLSAESPGSAPAVADDLLCATCLALLHADAAQGAIAPVTPPDTALGSSAPVVVDRRAARPEAGADDAFDDLLDADVAPTPAWRTGADGDRQLIADIEAGLDGHAAVLHSRRVPNTRGDVDHVIVAPSGIWIVDTKSYWGLVEQRDVGNWRTVDVRLFVNGRDRSEIVEDISWQTTGVRAALDELGLGDVPVHPVLLFIGSSGRWFSKPIEIAGVQAVWTTKLVELVRRPGPVDEASCRAIARHLDASLPLRP